MILWGPLYLHYGFLLPVEGSPPVYEVGKGVPLMFLIRIASGPEAPRHYFHRRDPMQINYVNYSYVGYAFIILMLVLLNGCVNHPSYYSEESCDYCVKQNEHFARIYKDAIFNNKLNKLRKEVIELKEIKK